jgi:hypothetical protein
VGIDDVDPLAHESNCSGPATLRDLMQRVMITAAEHGSAAARATDEPERYK